VLPDLWLILNVLALFSGFALIVAIIILRRVVPSEGSGHVLLLLVAFFLLAGLSLVGALRAAIGTGPGEFPQGVVTLAVLAFTLYAEIRYLTRFLHRPKVRRRRAVMSVVAAGAVALWALNLVSPELVERTWAFEVVSELILHSTISVFTVLVALTSVHRSRRAQEAPWQIFYRAFGAAAGIIALVHFANWLTITVLFPRLPIGRTELVFVVGYLIATGRLFVAVVRSFQEDAAVRSQLKPTEQFVDKYQLTRREAEIVEQIFDGKTNARIADKLCISVRTVDTHVVNIFRKCGVGSRYELFRLMSET